MKTKFSIIFLFFILNAFALGQDIKILSSDANSIIVQYLPVYVDTSTVSSNGTNYFNFSLPLTRINNVDSIGEAQILVRQLNIGVPSETGNTIQILSEEFSSLKGNLAPVPSIAKDSVSNHNVYSESSGYQNSSFQDAVSFGEYGLVRDLRVQGINIFPVQFDASSKTIRLLKKLVFKINYASVYSSINTKITNSYYEAFVINWSVAQNWGFKKSTLKKTTSSLFASGDWYRFETPDEGIYKIDYAALQSLGIDVSSIDPRTIKIYGYGGYSLPESLSSSNNTGMTENAIIVSGEDDGKFDSGDYILLYGRPTEFWEYSSSKSSIVRVKQPYSKKNYYWLTFGGEAGKRMEEKSSLSSSDAYAQPSTFAYKSLDKDSVNIAKGGRDYFGDPLNSSTKNRTYINSLSGILPSSTITYTFKVANTSTSSITFRLDESGTSIYSSTIYGKADYYSGTVLKTSVNVTNNLSDERSTLKFVLTSTATDAEMYLDYFEISYQKYLNAVSDNLVFFSKDTSAVISYVLSDFSNSSIKTFDITDFANASIISNASISGSQFTFQASESKGRVSKYIAINESQYKTPTNITKVTPTDLRSDVTGTEMIVITAKDLKTQAERYATYRSSQSPNTKSTSVYYVDDIFNEFSGGIMDPTAIRDFLKYAYENWQTKPVYVLLFGDGSYDYLDTEDPNINYVPTYQTYSSTVANSLGEQTEYPMDDYYSRVSGSDKYADLAVGRLCVQSTTDADNAVDKIVSYETSEDKGDWRNRITLVADDGPAGTGVDDTSTHTSQSETLTNSIIPDYIDKNKIYLVAYPTTYIGVGRRKPAVNEAIINAINNGTLVLNYVGHGAPKFWAHEYVFVTASAIPQMTNSNYFLLTAATCDFGRYDDPSTKSGTEELVELEGAGAILALSAARVVNSVDNAALCQQFYKNLFAIHETGGSSDRVGIAYMMLKQKMTGNNDEEFHLLGDPAIRLNLPKLPVEVDSLNGKSADISAQISALSTVTIKGTVLDESGNVNNISGKAIISVFDSKRSQYYSEMDYTITLQGGLIYRGLVSVENGEFSTEFVVPKDISYENKEGKIVVYFYNDDIDGVGLTNNFTVGGTDSTVVNDGKGPEIEIFFDSENYKDAYLVNPSFTLIAKLNDEVGLNTTGTGIGHKLEGILNDDLTNTIDFTNYFVGELNSGGKSGDINYSFSSMEPGDYKIKVKAWDVFNNYSSQETSFTVVSSSEGITVRDVYNYPNPFSSNTTFTFQHNFTSAINAKIKIYTIAGRMIKQIEEREVMDRFVRIDWDGRDEDGNSIANGTYLYKLIVEASDGSSKQSVLGKIAVIR